MEQDIEAVPVDQVGYYRVWLFEFESHFREESDLIGFDATEAFVNELFGLPHVDRETDM